MKEFLAKTHTNVLPYPPYSPDLTPRDFNEKNEISEKNILCHQMRGKEHRRRMLRKMASSCASRCYTNARRSVSSSKGATLKVDVLRCC
ncbi:hypothetical protein TNCV_3586721 [Trichonephila clavipes]|nr:hypothetical protein TNCV_3586721 [Trichonephila clavipes]